MTAIPLSAPQRLRPTRQADASGEERDCKAREKQQAGDQEPASTGEPKVDVLTPDTALGDPPVHGAPARGSS
jgi:hypothetical protein